jgi:hypothetical protein
MLDPLGPAQVGDMDEAVDALLDADEDTEIGDVLDLALDDRADRVALLETSTSSPTADHLGGMTRLLRPGHLGDVDETLNTFLQFDEHAVVGDGHDLAVVFWPTRGG